EMKTVTGYVRVSTPEATALDLVAYADRAGHLSHVATVLSELHESMKQKPLLSSIEQKGVDLPVVQRLGYLLDEVTDDFDTGPLAKWILEHRAPNARLRSDMPNDGATLDKKWRLFINDTIEADDI